MMGPNRNVVLRCMARCCIWDRSDNENIKYHCGRDSLGFHSPLFLPIHPHCFPFILQRGALLGLGPLLTTFAVVQHSYLAAILDRESFHSFLSHFVVSAAPGPTAKRPMGTSTSIELISSGTVIPITLPVTRNIRLLSPRRLDRVRHNKSAGTKRARYPKLTSVRSSAPPVNGASIDSMSLARDRQVNNARRATIFTRSALPLSDAALGGIIAGSLVVLWLLFVLVFFRRRSRNRLRASVGDVENRGLLPASHDSSRHRSASVIQSIDSPRLNPSPSPSPLLPQRSQQQRSQPLSEATTPISLPRPSNYQVPDGKLRKARLERPPPLVLRRERSDREARQGESLATARPRSIKLTGVSNRESVLPNPWDSGAQPSPAVFERVFFGLPSFSAPAPTSVRSKGSVKVGLPRTPRETRTFQPQEVRYLEVTQFAADRTTFEPRRGPGQT